MERTSRHVSKDVTTLTCVCQCGITLRPTNVWDTKTVLRDAMETHMLMPG